MTYIVVALFLGVFAAAIFALSLRFLIGSWLLKWLRGNIGLLLAMGSAFIALAAWDLRDYRQVTEVKPIATLAFNRLDDRRFTVALVDQQGREQRFELDGEMWQLDVRLLQWVPAIARLGLEPGFRLARLSGRYLSLEDERVMPHSVIELDSSRSVVDIWSSLSAVNSRFSLLEAGLSAASFMPMADGAMYSVIFDGGGVVAHPLNERAKLAVDRWQ